MTICQISSNETTNRTKIPLAALGGKEREERLTRWDIANEEGKIRWTYWKCYRATKSIFEKMGARQVHIPGEESRVCTPLAPSKSVVSQQRAPAFDPILQRCFFLQLETWRRQGITLNQGNEFYLGPERLEDVVKWFSHHAKSENIATDNETKDSFHQSVSLLISGIEEYQKANQPSMLKMAAQQASGFMGRAPKNDLNEFLIQLRAVLDSLNFWEEIDVEGLELKSPDFTP